MIQVLAIILLLYIVYSVVSIVTIALYFAIKFIREDRKLARDLEKL